jgi:hypothetical protein
MINKLFMALFGRKYRIRFNFVHENGAENWGKMEIECEGKTREQIEEHVRQWVCLETGENIRDLTITHVMETT